MFVQVCLYVGLCTCNCFHPAQRFFESIILLVGALCEIVDIAFSVEVPIGVPHTADNNRKLIRSWKSIVETHAHPPARSSQARRSPIVKAGAFMRSADANPHILCDTSLASRCPYL